MWMKPAHDKLSSDFGEKGYLRPSYRLLHYKALQKTLAWNNSTHLFCSWICDLGRAWRQWLISAPCNISWDGRAGTGGSSSKITTLWRAVDRGFSWGCQPGFWFLSMWASLGLPFSRAPRLQEKHPKRQEVGAANLFRPGRRSWHCVSSVLFYWSSSHRAHLDSRGGNLDPTSQWEEYRTLPTILNLPKLENLPFCFCFSFAFFLGAMVTNSSLQRM